MPRLDGVGAWRRGARCPRPTLDLYDIEPSAAPQELAVAIATGTFSVHRRPLGSREPDMVISGGIPSADQIGSYPMSSSFRSVAGQDGAGCDGGELAGGTISGGGGSIDTGGVTMMPGADAPVSAAGGACGSVSAQRRPAKIRLPSTKAAATMKSVFIGPISLTPVPLYSDRTDAAGELACRVARPTQKDVPCPVLMPRTTRAR